MLQKLGLWFPPRCGFVATLCQPPRHQMGCDFVLICSTCNHHSSCFGGFSFRKIRNCLYVAVVGVCRRRRVPESLYIAIFKKKFFFFACTAVFWLFLGLCCCTAFSRCGGQGLLSSCSVRASHGMLLLFCRHRLSGEWASAVQRRAWVFVAHSPGVLHSVWKLPGREPGVPTALTARFLPTRHRSPILSS